MYCLQFFFHSYKKIYNFLVNINSTLIFSRHYIFFHFLSLWTSSRVPLSEWKDFPCLQWALQVIQYINHLLLSYHYLPTIPHCHLFTPLFCFSKFKSSSVLLSRKAFTLENHKYYAYYEGHVSDKNQGVSIFKEAIKNLKIELIHMSKNTLIIISFFQWY